MVKELRTEVEVDCPAFGFKVILGFCEMCGWRKGPITDKVVCEWGDRHIVHDLKAFIEEIRLE